MSRLTEQILELIDTCDVNEKRILLDSLRHRVSPHPLEHEWRTTSYAILTAIARSSDLTHRGIRGILAEATFEESVLPTVAPNGWKAVEVVGDQAYDFLLRKGTDEVRVQVKLQRKEAGLPKEYAARARDALKCPSGKVYVVEVQKTRSGTRDGRKTRPYRFGDFDILAVNLHPSSGDWQRFAYTVSGWLLPRPAEEELIRIFQPVPERPDEYWTDDLGQCIEWFLLGETKRLYS